MHALSLCHFALGILIFSSLTGCLLVLWLQVCSCILVNLFSTWNLTLYVIRCVLPPCISQLRRNIRVADTIIRQVKWETFLIIWAADSRLQKVTKNMQNIQNGHFIICTNNSSFHNVCFKFQLLYFKVQLLCALGALCVP